jgi:hypothetical protein
LGSCKKTGTSDNNPPVSALTYQYKSITYTGDDGNWGLIFDGTDVTGITINRSDLFGGEVIYTPPGCAYTDPHTKLISKVEGCMLMYNDSTAIDSSVVYLYKSGAFNSKTSNCRQKKIVDIYTRETQIVQLCDIKVKFSLTLVNGKGNIIEINNGSVNGTFQFN